MTTHLVSLIAPCRNERDHIDAFVQSVCAQHLPEGWAMELLVADGQSDDGTAERQPDRLTDAAALHLRSAPSRGRREPRPGVAVLYWG